MAKKCPRGFVCTDWNTILMYVVLAVIVVGGVLFMFSGFHVSSGAAATPAPAAKPTVVVLQQPAAPPSMYMQGPQQFPAPVQRLDLGIPSIASRGPSSPFQQIGLLTGEGGSSGAASPDRTILPLFGRELDARRGKWNYYTRTDGHNPVQVPVRVKNRVCDDDTVGCDEVYSDDSVYVPVLGRSFNATVYKKSLF